MALLGVGMGFLASQLGKVVQASVDVSGRGEAGGLQFTGQQLGSSLGVALIGAVVLSGLTSNFVSNIQESPEISAQVSTQVSTSVQNGIDFVSSEQIAAAATEAGLDEATTTALVDDYEAAQLTALKAGLLGAALLALISLPFTRDLPHGRRDCRPQAGGGECRRLTVARPSTERWAIVRGEPMFLRVAEPTPEAPVILHLHGFAISGSYMTPTAALLADDFRTYVPDLPGIRPEPAARPIRSTIPELADSAADVLDTLGVERATVLGNSLGCAVLGAFAQRHPDRIERAIMVSPAGGIHNRPLLRAHRPARPRCPA